MPAWSGFSREPNEEALSFASAGLHATQAHVSQNLRVLIGGRIEAHRTDQVIGRLLDQPTV